MSASINISSRSRRATARRTRLIGQGGFMGGVKRRRPVRSAFIPRPIRTIVVRQPRLGEKKFFDQSFATATTAAWAILAASIVIPAQGVTVETRVGDKLSLTSINFRMFLSMNAVEAAAAPSPVILTRIIVGVTHVGVIAAATDVVDTGSTSQTLSWRKIPTVTDFTILKDFYIRVDPHALNEGAVNSFGHGTSVSEVIKFTHVFKKPIPVRFGAGTTTVVQNSVFILAVSTATGGVQNIETRARYLDA